MNGGRPDAPIECLSPAILDQRVDELPGQVLENLGLQLFNESWGATGNWEGVAEVLGICRTAELEEIRRHALREHVFPGYLMLKDWAKRNGSTVYVLLNALRIQGREDCIELVVKACQELRSMQLVVKIEDERGKLEYKTVPTRTDATLRDSLENVLSDQSGLISSLANYAIIGPSTNITWRTHAYHLKGVQLSLKKVDATDETRNRVYGQVQIPVFKTQVYEQQATGNMVANFNAGVHRTQVSAGNIPLNIPVFDQQSRSCNFTSRTTPKVTEPDTYMQCEYNNLDATSLKQMQSHFPTLSSSPDLIHMASESCNHPLKQTLLKKPASTNDMTSSATVTDSITAVKHSSNVTERSSVRERSLRHAFRRPQLSPHYENMLMKPAKSLSEESDYVPHNHPMISFANQAPNSAQTYKVSTSMDKQPLPCVQHPIYVPHANVQQPKPVPCLMQQRKDGYIEIVEESNAKRLNNNQNLAHVLRQQSEPDHGSTNIVCGTDKVRSRSFPDASTLPTAPSQCVVERGADGYTTFALAAVIMEVDQSNEANALAGNDGHERVVFNLPSTEFESVPIDRDENGYLSYSPANFNTSRQNTDIVSQESSNKPLVIQQTGDGYFGFASMPSHMTSGPAELPSPCTGYVSMDQSHNVSSGHSHHLVYASMSAEDEEEDADFTNEGIQGYSDIMHSDYEYEYINDNPSRPLPPKPSPPLPMKRRRLKPQEQGIQTSENTQNSGDPSAVPGWCESETEDTIWTTMKHHKAEDGNFIVWWMSSKRRYVITVSHLNELRHYAVYERQHQNGPVTYAVFSGAEEFASLRDLVEHYMREGLKGPDVPPGQRRGKRWQQFSHVKLRKPLKVKCIHKAVRVKNT